MLQKLEDQEKLQASTELEKEDRIKELKKDKERLEELLSLREKDLSEIKLKLDNQDSVKEKLLLQQKLRTVETEHQAKLTALTKVSTTAYWVGVRRLEGQTQGDAGEEGHPCHPTQP